MGRHLRAQRTGEVVFGRHDFIQPKWWKYVIVCGSISGVAVLFVWSLFEIYTALGGK